MEGMLIALVRCVHIDASPGLDGESLELAVRLCRHQE